MRKQTITLLILALLVTLSGRAADMTWCLVTDKGQAVELAGVACLLAASDDQFDIVCTDGTTISGVVSVAVEQREPSAIRTIGSDGLPELSQTVDGQLIITQAKAGTEAAITDLRGVRLSTYTLTDGRNLIDTSRLAAGSYILTIGQTSIKFIKR